MDILQKLPNELLLHLLSLSSAKDILSCAATCHSLFDLVKGSSELQLIIELAVQGLRLRNYPIRNHHGDKGDSQRKKSAMEKLSSLHKSTQAWRALRPFVSASIQLERYEYEIGEGIFGHALKDTLNRFRGLEFQRLYLEAEHEGKECATWLRYNDFGMNLADFSFDLSENLLVLVEDPPDQLDMHTKILKRVRLLALSENVPHPLARKVNLESPGEEPWYQCDIKICTSILAVHFAFPHQVAEERGRLSVWNWKTGDLLHTVGGVGGYAILTHNTIMILLSIPDEDSDEEDSDDESAGQGVMELKVLRLPPEQTTPSFSSPSSSSASSPTVPSPTSLRQMTLSLPLNTLPDGVYVFSDKPLADSPNFPSDLEATPYTLDETAERIVVLQFLTWNHYAFLSTRHLLRLFETTPEDLLSQPIPWDAWGTDGTFWMSAPHLQCGYTSVFGSRFCAISAYERLFYTDADGNVIRDEMDTTRCKNPAELRMLVMDFNERPIIRDRTKRKKDREGKADAGDIEMELVESPVQGHHGAQGPGEHADAHADEERALRRRGRIEVHSGITGTRVGIGGAGEIGEWACFSPHLDGMVVTRLPFRAFQRTDVQGYLDWIVGIDHLVGISREPKHTYDVMQFTEG